MSAYCSLADMNLTDAWPLIDPTSFLDSEAGNTAVGTSALDSSSFTPGAIVISAIAIKLFSRSASSGTFTVVLRTGGADVAGTSVTIDNTSMSVNGGWHVFKLSASVTLLAATAYTVRVVSSVAAAATLYRNATANNWSRALITTTNAFLANGDQIIVAGNHTGTGGAGNDVTVTIDQTGTPIEIGTTALTQSISVASRGTLALENSASTNYTMEHRGLCQVRGGTLKIGTSSTRVDSTSTFTWTADCVATADSGWNFHSGTVDMYGATSASWTNLTADVTSGASKQLTVASTTGFKVNDNVMVTVTDSANRSRYDTTAITSIDSATTMTVTSLSWSHTGTNDSNGDRRARVINLTRNVSLVGNSAALGAYIDHNNAAVVTMDCVAMWYLGSTAATTGKRGFEIRPAIGGTTVLNYCAMHVGGTTSSIHYNIGPVAAAASITITNCSSTVAGLTAFNQNTAGATACTIQYCIATAAVLGHGFIINGANQTVRDCEAIGMQASGNITGFSVSADNTNALPVSGNCSGNYSAFNNYGMLITQNTSSRSFNFDNFVVVDCPSGMYFGVNAYFNFKERQVFNNLSYTGGSLPPVLILGQGPYDFIGCTFALGAGTWSRAALFSTTAAAICDLRFINCTFTNGSLASMMGAMSHVNWSKVKFINCTGMPTSQGALVAAIDVPFILDEGVISSQRHNGTNDDHRAAIKQGWVTTDSTIKDTGMTRSARLTPNSASVKTGSAMIWRVRVTGGSTITVNVKWRKSVVGDGTEYNGSQPRLVMKLNDAVGIAADVVLATGTNAANGAWETIGGTSATFSDEGEVILYVDCDGTAGWLNIQEISVGSELNDMTYWNDGLPVQYLSGGSGGGGGGSSGGAIVIGG